MELYMCPHKAINVQCISSIRPNGYHRKLCTTWFCRAQRVPGSTREILCVQPFNQSAWSCDLVQFERPFLSFVWQDLHLDLECKGITLKRCILDMLLNTHFMMACLLTLAIAKLPIRGLNPPKILYHVSISWWINK